MKHLGLIIFVERLGMLCLWEGYLAWEWFYELESSAERRACSSYKDS
jgi:hypothetical protein